MRRVPDGFPLLDTEVDMDNDQLSQLVRALRDTRDLRQEANPRHPILAIVGIISVCVTIVGSALAISSQFSTFEGEMREWKRATDVRLERTDARMEHDEELLFKRMVPSP